MIYGQNGLKKTWNLGTYDQNGLKKTCKLGT